MHTVPGRGSGFRSALSLLQAWVPAQPLGSTRALGSRGQSLQTQFMSTLSEGPLTDCPTALPLRAAEFVFQLDPPHPLGGSLAFGTQVTPL